MIKVKLICESAAGVDRFRRNVSILSQFSRRAQLMHLYFPFPFDSLTPQNAPVLSQIDIDDKNPLIGQGAYGIVLRLLNGMVLKIFILSHDLQLELSRLQSSIFDVFGGSASLDDMHYFDHGVLGDRFDSLGRTLYYAIMPEIIPFQNSPAYRQNPDVFHGICFIMKMHASSDDKISSYSDFFDLIIHSLARELSRKVRDIHHSSARNAAINDYISRLNLVQDDVSRVIRAGWRAYSIHGGIDLHIGNLGYFRQKPENYFFFDM